MNEFLDRFFSSHFLPRFLTVVGFILFFYSTIALFVYRHNPLLSIDYFLYLLIGISFIIFGFLLEHNLKHTESLEHIVLLLSEPLKVEPVKKTESQSKSESKVEPKTESVNSKPIKSLSIPVSEPISEPLPKRVIKPVSPEEQARVKEQIRQRMLAQQQAAELNSKELPKKHPSF